MNLIEQLNSHKEHYTKNDLKIYNKIIEDIGVVVNHNITNLATKLDTSTAAISRFIKRNGFDSYNQFRMECMKYKNSEWNLSLTESKITNFANVYTTLINEVPNYVSQEQLDHLTNILIKADQIVGIGHYRSELYTRKLSIELLPYDKYIDVPSFDIITRHFDTIAENADCLILFSESMESRFIEAHIEAFNKYADKLMIISTSDHALKKVLGNSYVHLPNINNFPKSRNLDNAIIINLFINLLVNNFVAHILRRK